jgi:small subunit ribosomal protein S9
MEATTRYYGTGRRKNSIARVWLQSGEGKIVVNSRSVDEFFPRPALTMLLDEAMRGVLKKAGFLTRDPRVKERKKYGQKGARARFQFSKR